MEILCPLVGAICLSLTSAMAYQLQPDNSESVSVRHSRPFQLRGKGMQIPSFAINAEEFSNTRFKERKAIKRYSSHSLNPPERVNNRRIELVPPTNFKNNYNNVQNESSDNNLIENSEVRSNQRRGSHNSDVILSKPRERIDRRRIEVVAPTIYKKNAQNQSNEDHSIDKRKALSNQRHSHYSDGVQDMPITKEPKDYVRKFIENHQDILQNKMYEKPNYLAMNVHKAQVTTAPLSLNVRRKSPSKKGGQIQKVQVALGADKIMQGEKRAAGSDRKPDGKAQRSNEKDLKFRENKKRETFDRVFKDPPNHGFSESLKRYISFKDKRTVEPKSAIVSGAVGIRTDSIEENGPVENPYAIFYKMHQNLDDGFIPASGGSVKDDSKLFNIKNKQISANYETKNPNRVMKKFFSYKNNKHY